MTTNLHENVSLDVLDVPSMSPYDRSRHGNFDLHFGFHRVRFGPFFGNLRRKWWWMIFAHWAGVGYINVMTHKSVSDLRSLGKEMNLGKQSFTCSFTCEITTFMSMVGRLVRMKLCPDPSNQRSFQEMKDRTGVDCLWLCIWLIDRSIPKKILFMLQNFTVKIQPF